MRKLLQKKGVVPFLLAAALAVWIYNFYSIKKELSQAPGRVNQTGSLAKPDKRQMAEAPLYDMTGRDPFRYGPGVEPASSQQARPAVGAGVSKEAMAIPKLVLGTIMYDSKNPMAIINSNSVSVGDVVEGAKIRKITEESVELEYKGKRFILK